MKGTTVTLLAAAAGIIFAQLPATAQNRASSEGETSQRQQVLAPNIAHVAVRATLLHWGMLQADIARVMPAPSQVVAADDEGAVRVLRYSAEPIATTVTITDGKLSSVALDVAGADDPALPNFARAAWLGMNRATVLRILGVPSRPTLRGNERRTDDIRATGGGPMSASSWLTGAWQRKRSGDCFPPTFSPSRCRLRPTLRRMRATRLRIGRRSTLSQLA